MVAGGIAHGATPVGNLGDITPSQLRALTPEHIQAMRWEKELDEKNRYLTDEELDAMFPPEGYKILETPADYVPVRTPARKYQTTPGPGGMKTILLL